MSLNINLKNRGIGYNERTAKLEDFPNELVEKVKNNSTFICGSVGTGKTHLLSAIVLASKETKNEFNSDGKIIEDTNLPILVNFSDLLFKLKGAYGNFKETEYSILERIIWSPLVCLDDIGTSKPTEWNIEILYAIINGRYQNGKRTHIASNFSRSKIADIFDERIASRITEMCIGIKLGGKDRRLFKS